MNREIREWLAICLISVAVFTCVIHSTQVASQTVYDLDQIEPDVTIIGSSYQSMISEAIVLDFDNSGAGDLFFRETYNSRQDFRAIFNLVGYLDFSKNQTGRVVDVADGGFDILISEDAALGHQLGHSYASGDWNHDGIDDLAVADRNAFQAGHIARGAVYVIFGGSQWQSGGIIDLALTPADILITSSDMTTDPKIGVSMVTLDINHDGIDDLAIGAQDGENSLGLNAGAVYVVYGSDSFTPPVEIDVAQGEIDLSIQGKWAGDWFGNTLSAGDVNGDGVDDLVVGAENAWHDGDRFGAMYAFFGSDGFPPNHVIDLQETEAGVMVVGSRNAGFFGTAVNSGDFNGDGIDDMCGGEIRYETTHEYEGAVYLFWGSDTFAPGTILDLRTEQADVSFFGEEVDACVLGKFLSSGDLNSDGMDELCISSNNSAISAESYAGVHHIFFGMAEFPPQLAIELQEYPSSLMILGEDAGDAYPLFSSLTDVNGDGLIDIIIGHSLADRPEGMDCGKIYIFYSDGLPIDRPPRVLAGPGPDAVNPPELRLWDPFFNADGWSSRFSPFLVQGYGLNTGAGDLDGDSYDEIVVGPGPGPHHPPTVQVLDEAGRRLYHFQAYGTPRYGVNVCAGDLDGDGDEEVVTGAGPGAVYGPHVRGWDLAGEAMVPLGKVSFLAYGTLRWGVNVTSGDIDGDGFDEIITGAGPGAVFGAHVRGWNVDGGAAAPIGGVSYFAYGTPRWGVNVSCGDLDGDGIDEIVTAPGPGEQFSSHVRGWNYDGEALASITGVNFISHPNIPHCMGCVVACGDLDNDGIDEILTVPGPHPDNPARLKSWNFDGDVLEQIDRMSFMVFEEWPYRAGARLAFGNFHQDPPFLP